MKLTEAQIRSKVVELLDGMNLRRMDVWLVSGVQAQVFDEGVATRIMQEELPRRSADVRAYWEQPCACGCQSDADIATEVLGIIGPPMHTAN